MVQFAAEMSHLKAAAIEMAHLIGCTSCVCEFACVYVVFVVQLAAEMVHLKAASIEIAHLIGCTSCMCEFACVYVVYILC